MKEMKGGAIESVFPQPMREGICSWLRQNLLLLFFMMVLRLFFIAEVHIRLGIDASHFWGILGGSLFDLTLLCRIIAFLALPYLLFHFFFPKTTQRVYFGLIILYGIVSALLTEYYCNLSMPLDHVVLVYTPEEVKGAATSSASVTATPFLWFVSTIAVLVTLSLLWKKMTIGFRLSVLLLLTALVWSCSIPYKKLIREERYYREHQDFCLAVNQPSYAYIKITDYLRETRNSFTMLDEEVSQSVIEAAKRYQALHPEFVFLDPEYPFYRKADDPDVLGTLLEQTSDSLPPNLVFIIIEGFGQHLTGVETPAISFTPFIDSLKQQGLYWENCLSTAERTFGVLPSIFVSAPYGKYGFCTSSRPMPDHHSLLRDLKDNGYTISYYYGCIPSYGRYDVFLEANKVDEICLPDTHNIDSTNYQLLNEAHRWGLDDRESVRQMIGNKQKELYVRPRADILMTLTTHEPFLFQEVEAYERLVMEIVAQHPEVSERERDIIVKNANVYACFRYMDDCIRELLGYYKTLPEYGNTLFILTGDHRMGLLNFTGTLSKYHVPLLLFSPMVKQPRSMKAVVSHLDIAPTLNAYLQANYDYHINSECHWMGRSLDTMRTFRNTRKQAFMLNNRDVVEYVDNQFLLSINRVFSLDEELLTHQVQDENRLSQLKSELADYTIISQFAVLHNHLNINNKELEVLRSLDVDFESRYDKYYKYYVKKIGDNHSAFVDTTKMFGPLLQDLKLNMNYKDVYLDIAFDLHGLDTLRELPLLVVELGDYYASVLLNSEEETSLNTGRRERFQAHISIAVPGESQGKVMKAYLRNYDKTTMLYDNLRIRVTAKR